jgi:mono/diheme cytochrome c family protein
METSPAWKPQEMETVLPAHSVPVTGREEVIQDAALLATLVNPIAPTATSVEVGEVLFTHHCSACHGEAGQGGAPMAEYYGEPPSLLGERGLNLTDGFIYNTIREGRSLMPPLGETLSAEERWHIVNYLRRLQQQ